MEALREEIRLKERATLLRQKQLQAFFALMDELQLPEEALLQSFSEYLGRGAAAAGPGDGQDGSPQPDEGPDDRMAD